MPADGVPDRVAVVLPGVIADCEQSIAPVGIKGAAVMLRGALRQFMRFGTAEQITAFTEQTVASLAEYPADIVANACKNVVETHRFSNLPLTADFVLPVREAVAERRTELRRLKVAQLIAKRQKPQREWVKPTEEEVACVDAILVPLKAMSQRNKPREEDRRPYSTAAVRAVEAETKGFKLKDHDDPVVMAELEKMKKAEDIDPAVRAEMAKMERA